jgi:2-polyprenyl-6-methoxyphenol hydroxylase-like FAD-dependent oxidoreductase
MVTLGGQFRDYPPGDEQGFLDFAGSLLRPELSDILRYATPVTPIATYRFPAHVWNHYEQLEQRPQGLLVLGDALCSFSPLYGQGMTVAALEARILQSCLAKNGSRDLRGLTQAYYRGIVGPVRSAWDMATGADLAYPETVGPRSRVGSWMGRYLAHVVALTCYDPLVLKAWVEMTNMLNPNSAVFHPRIAVRVLKRIITGGPALPTQRPREIVIELPKRVLKVRS